MPPDVIVTDDDGIQERFEPGRHTLDFDEVSKTLDALINSPDACRLSLDLIHKIVYVGLDPDAAALVIQGKWQLPDDLIAQYIAILDQALIIAAFEQQRPRTFSQPAALGRVGV